MASRSISNSLYKSRQKRSGASSYFTGLSMDETAAVLGLSEGTVKSAASRGLRRMRDLAAPWHTAIAAEETT